MREIKFRAWYNYPCSDLKPKTPYGTGSDWFPRWQMGIVQTYYQSKNKVRISGFQRYYSVDGSYKESKDSCDMQIGGNCILMQYTGLKDKNGVEIYEGDVIREEYRIERVDGSMPYNTNRTTGVVSFKVHEDDDYEGFYAHGWFVGDYSLTPRFVSGSYNNPYWKIKDGDTFGFEIIGNIYENPELLK